MSIEQRQHIRFSLEIPAIRFTAYGERIETILQQISIGGCLIEWEESMYPGEEFRLLIQLPNNNFLPLACKVIYRSEDNGIGATFLDITRFEQELLTTVISNYLKKEGLPLQVDPFALPDRSINVQELRITDPRRQKEELLDKIISGENRLQL